LIFTGGQFGKSFFRNLKTKQSNEFIDQVQAHKRKITIIKATNSYVFTAAADQKIKQWSLSGAKLVWSVSLGWIPTTLTVQNKTIYVGGPSVVSQFPLIFVDQEITTARIELSTDRLYNNIFYQLQNDGLNVAIVSTVIIGLLVLVVGACLILYKFYYSKAKIYQKSEQSTTSTATETQTLVTDILKISLPGYKELSSFDFRLVTKLAQGGGGEVYIGEALSPKCGIFGKQIIVKQFFGKI
jgi:hypothetical protein